MLESALADAVLSGAINFVYIAGLVGFVAWLKRKQLFTSHSVVENS
jgi:hypothetical protein